MIYSIFNGIITKYLHADDKEKPNYYVSILNYLDNEF